MKILYGIQGTGNGHLSRGAFIYNLLGKYSQEVDVLLSGNNYSLIPSEAFYYPCMIADTFLESLEVKNVK